MKTTNGFDSVTTSKILESVEVSMYEDLFDAIPAELATREGLSLQRYGGPLFLTAGSHDHPIFNRVMGVGLGYRSATETAETVLNKAVEHYRKAGVRRWMIQLLPHMESEAFREAAGRQGVIRLRGWAKHLAEAWAQIVVDNFGLPPEYTSWLRQLADRNLWLLYVAMDGDTPVATAALFHTDVGGEHFAELNFASTLPDYQRRGAQTALIAHRVADARNLGARWIVSETDEERPDKPNPSYRNLVRLGFPVIYVRANWGPPKPGK